MPEEITLRFFKDTRTRWPLFGRSYQAECWCAELAEPSDSRAIFGHGDTLGEAADDLMGKLYPVSQEQSVA